MIPAGKASEFEKSAKADPGLEIREEKKVEF